jgi:subtilisin family serine protease
MRSDKDVVVRSSSHASAFSVDPLEHRKLMSWGTVTQVIDQDDAIAKYPSVNGRGVVIADLDTGISFNHAALSGRIWTNPGEIAGNRRDDDGNGYVDDVHGWDFIDNDNSPHDDQGHGTMTAGIMVANRFTNRGNYRGYAGDGREYQGIASDAKVIPLRVVGKDVRLDAYRVEKALRWVISNHKRYNIVAVNMSLDVRATGYPVIEDELRTLWNAGVFIGASSGNAGNTDGRLAHPAEGTYAAAVGSSDLNNTISSITSRGSDLDLVAPGQAVPFLGLSSDYYLGGTATSYATPFVTAAGALLKQIDPTITPAQIVQTLRDTGDGIYDSGTRLTFKRIDLDDAIARTLSRVGGIAPSTPLPPPPPPAPTTTTSPFRIGTPIEAEKATDVVGITRSWNALSHIDGPDHAFFKSVNFGSTGATRFAARLGAPASFAGKQIEIRLDGRRGRVIGTLTVKSTGAWGAFQVQSTGIARTTGTHDVYLTFNGGNGVANLDWILFR